MLAADIVGACRWHRLFATVLGLLSVNAYLAWCVANPCSKATLGEFVNTVAFALSRQPGAKDSHRAAMRAQHAAAVAAAAAAAGGAAGATV